LVSTAVKLFGGETLYQEPSGVMNEFGEALIDRIHTYTSKCHSSQISVENESIIDWLGDDGEQHSLQVKIPAHNHPLFSFLPSDSRSNIILLMAAASSIHSNETITTKVSSVFLLRACSNWFMRNSNTTQESNFSQPTLWIALFDSINLLKMMIVFR
jgi:hypothetical protein